MIMNKSNPICKKMECCAGTSLRPVAKTQLHVPEIKQKPPPYVLQRRIFHFSLAHTLAIIAYLKPHLALTSLRSHFNACVVPEVTEPVLDAVLHHRLDRQGWDRNVTKITLLVKTQGQSVRK